MINAISPPPQSLNICSKVNPLLSQKLYLSLPPNMRAWDGSLRVSFFSLTCTPLTSPPPHISWVLLSFWTMQGVLQLLKTEQAIVSKEHFVLISHHAEKTRASVPCHSHAWWVQLWWHYLDWSDCMSALWMFSAFSQFSTIRRNWPGFLPSCVLVILFASICCLIIRHSGGNPVLRWNVLANWPAPYPAQDRRWLPCISE